MGFSSYTHTHTHMPVLIRHGDRDTHISLLPCSIITVRINFMRDNIYLMIIGTYHDVDELNVASQVLAASPVCAGARHDRRRRNN